MMYKNLCVHFSFSLWKKLKKGISFLILNSTFLIILTACSASVPDNYIELTEEINIYPDYKNVVVPYNIAPLNFRIDTGADDYITSIQGKNGNTTVKGKYVKISVKDWHKLLSENKGQDIIYQPYAKKNGKWHKYPAFRITIAEEPIDEYLSYRLIEPSYKYYEELSIVQRNLTNFDEKDIYNNLLLSERQRMQCINCHAYQNYKTGNMQFHTRGHYPGTIIVADGQLKKVDMKNEKLISNGVYPSWHPTEKLIAYSVNSTIQRFYLSDNQKVEVQDTKSDLILYDVQADRVSYIVNDPDYQETFPSWSPDGKTLYFVSAYLPGNEGAKNKKTIEAPDSIRYDLLRVAFNEANRTFGIPDTVFKASAIEKSVTLPRISPDGRYLLFTLGDYGTFHIWHNSSDLHLIDLQTGAQRKLENVNSPDVESYHTWSSNGRWIVFSSRRDDGSYTRPYIAYFSNDGKAFKPFILPQKEPDFYGQFYKSFNIPEFMTEPVKISAKQFANTIKEDPKLIDFKE